MDGQIIRSERSFVHRRGARSHNCKRVFDVPRERGVYIVGDVTRSRFPLLICTFLLAIKANGFRGNKKLAYRWSAENIPVTHRPAGNSRNHYLYPNVSQPQMQKHFSPRLASDYDAV